MRQIQEELLKKEKPLKTAANITLIVISPRLTVKIWGSSSAEKRVSHCYFIQTVQNDVCVEFQIDPLKRESFMLTLNLSSTRVRTGMTCDITTT